MKKLGPPSNTATKLAKIIPWKIPLCTILKPNPSGALASTRSILRAPRTRNFLRKLLRKFLDPTFPHQKLTQIRKNRENKSSTNKHHKPNRFLGNTHLYPEASRADKKFLTSSTGKVRKFRSETFQKTFPQLQEIWDSVHHRIRTSQYLSTKIHRVSNVCLSG